jgi:hypothetical protein
VDEKQFKKKTNSCDFPGVQCTAYICIQCWGVGAASKCKLFVDFASISPEAGAGAAT